MDSLSSGVAFSRPSSWVALSHSVSIASKASCRDFSLRKDDINKPTSVSSFYSQLHGTKLTPLITAGRYSLALILAYGRRMPDSAMLMLLARYASTIVTISAFCFTSFLAVLLSTTCTRGNQMLSASTLQQGCEPPPL